MHITDPLYGTFEIESPAILELLNSKPIQRLKNISQQGLSREYYFKDVFTRYDHCVGVMLLLRKLGASEEEQIAGLLHDVSHTTFSHVIDLLLHTTASENFQDTELKKYIERTGIGEILRRHNIRPEKTAFTEHFTLLEQSIPELCADRIDYALREFQPNIAEYCVEHLRNHEGKIIFDSEDSANIFAKHFLECQRTFWGGYEPMTRYFFLVAALKSALEKHIIVFDDFWTTDKEVEQKLLAAHDPFINKIFETLKQPSLLYLPKSDKVQKKKFRYVDPLFLDDGQCIRLSEDNPNFAKILEEARRENEEGILLPMLP